jgi:integrase
MRHRRRTVAQAVAEYLAEKALDIKESSMKTYRSTLQGSDNPGRPAAGTPLARCWLSKRDVSSVTVAEWKRWFQERCPETMSTDAHRRNAVIFSGFLEHAVRRGWISPVALEAKRRGKHGESNRNWLRPEPLRLINRVVDESDALDDYRRFQWQVLACTGARTFEVPPMQRQHLNVATLTLHVPAGKGERGGKPRDIPTDEKFARGWIEYADRHALRGSDHMFWRRDFRSLGGRLQTEGEWVTVSKSLPTSSASVRATMTRIWALAQAQIDPQALPQFDLTPKVMRKTFACNQLILHRLGLGGMSPEQLQAALGHNDPRTTRIYLPDVEGYLNQVTKPTNTLDAAEAIVQEVQRRAAT